MWHADTKKIDKNTLHVCLYDDIPGKCLSFAEVSHLAQEETKFRSWFTQQLKETPMDAYFWEAPPVTRKSFARDFEYVLINAPSLSRFQPDPLAFGDQFNDAASEIVVFRNLGRDAILVAPVPLKRDNDYAHLAAFLRSAPKTQIDALWKGVFKTLAHVLTDKPVWVSTSGLGVAWLHIRLDSIPKYYNYRPYKRLGKNVA
ncbi:MAG: hypothetical protein QNI91_13010 [Arenicellales bacterium]|nr:hypothetical protein [Arenicellales bacterium]